jgi:hypothetical protein
LTCHKNNEEKNEEIQNGIEENDINDKIKIKDNPVIHDTQSISADQEIPQEPKIGNSIRITSDFIRRVQDEKDIFPIAKQEKRPRVSENVCKFEKILLYLAEIINLECHDQIKCSKYKVGYIIREKMDASHKSRITHTDPFANFYWSALLFVDIV